MILYNYCFVTVGRNMSTYWSFLFHAFLSIEKKQSLLCVACYTTITVKHILIECADLVEVRKKYLEVS